MNFCKLCKAQLQDNTTCRQLYDQLAFYTLAHKDQHYFIHQLIVDSYGAQHLTENSKPIASAFTLIGLYLFSEKNYTGKEVQNAHMQLGKEKWQWPKFILPENRGKINAFDVLKVESGEARDEMIKEWARSTWQAYSQNRSQIINLLVEARFKDLR